MNGKYSFRQWRVCCVIILSILSVFFLTLLIDAIFYTGPSTLMLQKKSQQIFPCSKAAVEALEKSMEYVWS